MCVRPMTIVHYEQNLSCNRCTTAARAPPYNPICFSSQDQIWVWMSKWRTKLEETLSSTWNTQLNLNSLEVIVSFCFPKNKFAQSSLFSLLWLWIFNMFIQKFRWIGHFQGKSRSNSQQFSDFYPKQSPDDGASKSWLVPRESEARPEIPCDSHRF